ncbi:major capsid protein [Capybara microvirus Cap1_SP_66]|nr:major capsid protein [Capybara microvirus Cap1_SP_66]
MSKNIFRKREDFVNKQKRNNFDLSHRVHGSYKMGLLYPISTTPVIAGSSVNIRIGAALQAAALMFPVQTPIKCRMSAFYVRYRNLWDEYKRFYGDEQTKLSFPVIQQDKGSSFWDVGGLADHLDVPIVYYGLNTGNNSQSQFSRDCLIGKNTFALQYGKNGILASPSQSYTYYTSQLPYSLASTDATYWDVCFDEKFVRGLTNTMTFPQSRLITKPTGQQVTVSFNMVARCYPISKLANTATQPIGSFNVTDIPSAYRSFSGFLIGSDGSQVTLTIAVSGTTATYSLPSGTTLATIRAKQDSGVNFVVYLRSKALSGSINLYSPLLPNTILYYSAVGYGKNYSPVNSGLCVNPFGATESATPTIPLSAMPFRAYESIYNCFYRKERVDPLMIDGLPAYDEYCPNVSGGKDSYNYQLHKVPFEEDRFTSALPSPQAGDAPLVGLQSASYDGKIHVTMKDSSGASQEYEVQSVYDDDGMITGFAYTEDIPYEVRQNLNKRILAGFDINSLRNASAMQKFLENKIRRGYKYTDQLLAHMGVSPKYNVLNMPEYLGGQTFEFDINKISSTTANDNVKLGDYAAQMQMMGASQHSINHYCDEDGLIMVVMSIVPICNYPQALPHHFLQTNKLDFFTSEFDKISMQPITYREVAPVQAANAGNVNDTFGYQLPWDFHKRDYDKIRGEMRTTMRDFVINRIYDGVPHLNSSFIYCNQDDLNRIYQVTDENEDKIFGSFLLKITARHPMSTIGQPTFH